MWRDKFVENLKAANSASDSFQEYYDAFELAAKRAVANVSDSIDPEYVGGLERQVQELESKLKATIKQLNEAQRRARDMNEEQYMKTHAVQALHDEILALNLQLNVSEETQRELKTENEKLVSRWIAKIDAEAAAAQ